MCAHHLEPQVPGQLPAVWPSGVSPLKKRSHQTQNMRSLVKLECSHLPREAVSQLSPPVRQLHRREKDRLSQDQRPVSQCLPRCFYKCADRRSGSTRDTKATSSLNTSRRDKPGGQCDHRAFLCGELASQAGVAAIEWAWNRVGVHSALLCTCVCGTWAFPQAGARAPLWLCISLSLQRQDGREGGEIAL